MTAHSSGPWYPDALWGVVRFDEIMEKQQGKDNSVEGTNIQVMKPDEASEKP